MIQEDIFHAVLMKSLISSDLGRTLLARYNQFSCFIRKNILSVMLRKWLQAKEEEITLWTEQNPKVLWTKSFLHAHNISEMNVCLGSVGIIF